MRVKYYEKALFDTLYSSKENRIIPSNVDDSEIERDITYNTIIEDLKDLGHNRYYSELQNRLDVGENINQILLSIINRNRLTKSIIGYHTRVIEHYINQDIMALFK